MRRIYHFDRKPNINFVATKQHWDKNIIYKDKFIDKTFKHISNEKSAPTPFYRTTAD